MALLPWMSVLMMLHGCYAYILLTANLDDVQAIAKQIAESSVAGHLNTIFRRASNIFNQQLRARNDDGHPHRSPRANSQESYLSSEPVQDNRVQRRSQADPTHQKYGHHQRRSGTDGSQNNNKKSHEDLAERQSQESGTKDHKESNSAHQNNEELHDDLDHQKVERSREEVAEHEARSKTDEVVALGKNVSLYLNSIKKIMENI